MSDIVAIEKFNSVYIRIDAEPSIIYELAEAFSFKIPNHRYHPKVKSGVWDGIIRLLNTRTRLIYAGLFEDIEKFCAARDYEVEYRGDWGNTEFSLKEAQDFIATLNIPPERTPRDYQVDAFVSAVRYGGLTLLCPTASGKSLIIYLLTRYYNTKTLIIVPSLNLVNQMGADFEEYNLKPGLVHQISGGKDKHSTKPIHVGTWQSLYKMPVDFFSQYGILICDEVHLAQATSLKKIMESYLQGVKFGLTGTLDDIVTNQMTIKGLFGPIKQVITTRELMDAGHISDIDIKTILLQYPDEVRKSSTKLTYQQEIDYLVANPHRNNFIKNLALSLKGNTLVMYQFVEKHGEILYKLIKESAGERPVYFINGEVDVKERERFRKLMEEHDDAIYVASYGTWSTGANTKKVHNSIFAHPRETKIGNLQTIGRGLRKADDKDGFTLYDIADDLSWKSHKNYTLKHWISRVKLYAEQKFSYKIYKVKVKS